MSCAASRTEALTTKTIGNSKGTWDKGEAVERLEAENSKGTWDKSEAVERLEAET